MKYLFLLVGLIAGIFWSQVYFEFGKVFNVFMVQQQPAPPKKVEKAAVRVKSESQPKVSPQKTESSGDTKQVIMYTTSWCGYCKAAREYFRQNRVSYIEYDIEKDERAERMHELLGGGGVPLIVFNGKKMSGFSPTKFLAMYQ